MKNGILRGQRRPRGPIELPHHRVALTRRFQAKPIRFGLRISECLALKWSDVDWFSARLHVQRSIVRQRTVETKTEYSNRPLAVHAGMLDVLKNWRQKTQFSKQDDWIFASPVKLGLSD